MPFKKILMLILILQSNFLFSQIVIKGTVTDINRKTIPSASIMAVATSTSGKMIVLGYTFSDNEGKYTLKLKPSDSIVAISANLLGFNKKVHTLNIINNVNLYDVHFELEEAALSLQTFTVKAENLDRIVRKDTTTFKVKFFIDSTERILEDVLKKIPGIVIKEDGSIEYKNKPIERILVEGDDVFRTETKLPSKNLHADLVEEVQIIDRYSDNPLLKDIVNSDRQVINLNFKQGKKKALFGNIGLGGGVTNRYEITSNLISFIGKTKAFIIASANNIGNDIGSNANRELDINHLRSNDYFNPTARAASLVPILSINAPALSPRRTNINEAWLTSFHFLTRPTKDWILKATAVHTQDNLLQIQQSNSQVLLGISSFLIKDNNQSSFKPRYQNFHIENMIPLSKDANLLIVNEYRQGQTQANTNIDINERNISQQLNNQSAYWRNVLVYTQKLTDSLAIVLNAAWLSDHKPQTLLLRPKDNYSSLIQSTSPTFLGIEQQAWVKTQYAIVEANLKKVWKANYKFNIKIGGSLQRDSTQTWIWADNLGEKQLLQDINFQNNAIYQQTDWWATVGYHQNFEKVRLSITTSFHNLNTVFTDKIHTNDAFNQNWVYLSPRLIVDWNLKGNDKINFSYQYNPRFMDIQNLLGGYYFRSYRALQRNEVQPFQINSHFATLNYRFERVLKKIEGNIFFSYSNNANTQMSRLQFTPFYTLTELTNTNKNFESYFVNAEIMRLLNAINLSVKLTSQQFLNISYNSIGRNDFERVQNISTTQAIQVVSLFKQAFNFTIGGSWSFNQQKTQTNGVGTNPTFHQWQSWLKTTWKLNPKLSITTNKEYNLFQSDLSSSNNNIFMDISLQYQIKPSKSMLYIDFYNIFNNQEYQFSSVSANQMNTQIYRLLPRILLAKFEYRF